MEILDVSKNQLGYITANLVFSNFQNLKSLNISNNRIQDQGFQILSEGFKNRKFEFLDFSFNYLTDKSLSNFEKISV